MKTSNLNDLRRIFAISCALLLTSCGAERPDYLKDIKGNSIVVTEASAKAAPAAVASLNKAKYEPVSFEMLSNYSYNFPNVDGKPIEKNEKFDSGIPKNIRAFDGKPVVIKGYMIPLQTEDNGAKRFILSQFVPTCCFGDTIKMTQWMDVQMGDGKRCKYQSGSPIIIFGTLQVGEDVENGYVTSLYRLKPDDVIAPSGND